LHHCNHNVTDVLNIPTSKGSNEYTAVATQYTGVATQYTGVATQIKFSY